MRRIVLLLFIVIFHLQTWADCIDDNRFYPNGTYYFISDSEEIEEDILYARLSEYSDSTLVPKYILEIKANKMGYVTPGRMTIIEFSDKSRLAIPIDQVGPQGQKLEYFVMGAWSFHKTNKRTWVSFNLNEEQMKLFATKGITRIIMDSDSEQIIDVEIKKNKLSLFFAHFMDDVNFRKERYEDKEDKFKQEMHAISWSDGN